MTIKMALFDENKSALKERLNSLDVQHLELENLVEAFGPPGFVFPPKESNNPWQGYARDGSIIDRSFAEDLLGFGVPLFFDDAAQALEVLAPILNSENAEIKRLVSTDFTPSLSYLTPRGLHWCAGAGRGASFGTWRQAHTLINADALSAAGLTGRGVKVFVVDQGINRNYIEGLGGTYGGGMGAPADGEIKMPGEGKVPYQSLNRRHGSMIVRTILELAPDAEIYDLPLIPKRISSVEAFVDYAVFAFLLLRFIFLSQPGPWVIVNPWGVVDRFGEGIRGDYTNNKDNWLNQIIGSIAEKHDVVFSAGNNGQFCANPRASGYDVGPGQSIFGANGHPEVTSVGAVRTDGAWVGASSQGPGPEDFSVDSVPPEKPDFCAPSWFVDNEHPELRSSGTSAAAAVTAGAMAALRDQAGWHDTTTVDPNALRIALRLGARQTDQSGWNERTGTGILNLAGAMGELPSLKLGKAT